MACPVLAKSFQSCVTPWTVAHQTPLSMEFSRQEYWSGWPFPPPGDLPDPGLRWCCVQGACTAPCFCSQPPAFALGASEWLLGFLVSLCLLSRICPNCACVQLLFVSCSFFAFCCLRRRRRQWHPTPVPLPGKSHGRRSLIGCNPWGHTRLK